MRVLVTGSRGLVGSTLVPALQAEGHDVVEYDLVNGDDILDLPLLESKTRECEAVIHLAALLEPQQLDVDRITRVNVEGTSNVLAAARASDIRRVVYLSSASVLGVFKGRRTPAYLPIDDAHPCFPSSPYEKSKLAAERLCEEFGGSDSTAVIALRPPGVWTQDTYHQIRESRAEDPEYEWHPFWEYGAFIDVRDLAAACVAALTAPVDGYVNCLVASSDITTSGGTSRELAARLHPGVEWRGDRTFVDRPFQTLVRIDRAQRVLKWRPRFTWNVFLQSLNAIAP